MYFEKNSSNLDGQKKPKPQKNQQDPKREQGDKKNNEFQWKRAGKTSLIWVMILMVAIFLSGLLTSKEQSIEIQYFQYREYLESRQISRADIIENIFYGQFATPQAIQTEVTVLENISRFHVILPFIDRDIMTEWDSYGVNYSFKGKSIDWTGYFLNMLPWLLLIGIWIFFIRRMQGGGGGMRGIFNFGKSRAKVWTSDMPKVTFDDVAGCIEAKEELKEVIEFLKKPKRFQKLGAKIPKGALLIGPPGTGKTLLARAVAGEAGVPFYSLSGAEFVEMFVGVGASRVRDLFEQGKKNTPCIVFIDELDAVGRQRGAGLGGGHDEREQTLNQLLVEMDGFDSEQMVIVLAATNRPDVLDPALLRPGRFDRQIVVDIPDIKGRLGILKVHTKKIVLNKRKINLDELARGTPGLVGADLANLVNEAALLAARKRKKSVDMEDFEDAKDKVMMGIQRKSVILSDEEKKVTAYHESGHTLVATMTPGADPIHKVTIIPRGQALGITAQIPIDEKHNYSREYIEGRMAILLGGRAAEQLIFNELTTGAGDDIEKATVIARKMVCEWGMSDVLGPMTFGKKNEEVFLGREIQSHRDFSESTARMIDEEVVRIIRKAQRAAVSLLEENVAILHTMADGLLKYETLDSKDITRIMDGKKLTRSKNGRPKKSRPKKRKKVQVKKSVSAEKPEKNKKETPSKPDEG
ncbi:MAG: ATP-dependent zinc metalloprotease FtsH [Candidatus Marinimicrobia bacterium]|jgi:cell division protease FtsH|nr:ATP-dependent zinc metalloprotease FtsH [Candidatus Neomarinimicrobiota bacterium]MDP7095439.1 ATP-dependent zinc metalloprotease FtsH [Candidatus Neomarinimicrobiota bacterium]MDP7165354.1 ATP-dependent zinc metalloprotease FtsH [Candidatus Neomarinimicrobiota bacterium]HJM12076.1 ATP-dependent zinc metalloprotease FtsH [Candidatus Neomarinimicrobiota bacterium]|tara:strand:- start:1367 stop:3451 length:2085 start_codon:yes stop_codon:yes gene_type:complete